MSTIAAIRSTSAAPEQTAPSPRLVNAAHEFEAQMMKELLKPMTRGDALTNDGDESGDEDQDSGGALGEFASEALGRAISDRGGFGIASSIIKQLSHASASSQPVSQPGNSSQTLSVTGKRHIDTVIKASQ